MTTPTTKTATAGDDAELPEKTYHFTITLEQDGTDESDAWERLLGYIADAPTEAIDAYDSVRCVDDELTATTQTHDADLRATCPTCGKQTETAPNEFERCTRCNQCFECCALNCDAVDEALRVARGGE